MNVTSIRANYSPLTFKATRSKKDVLKQSEQNPFLVLPHGGFSINSVNMGSVALPSANCITGAISVKLKTSENEKPVMGTQFLTPGVGFPEPIVVLGNSVSNYNKLMKTLKEGAPEKLPTGFFLPPPSKSPIETKKIDSVH